MHRTRHAKLIGFLFLAPALLFVARVHAAARCSG